MAAESGTSNARGASARVGAGASDTGASQWLREIEDAYCRLRLTHALEGQEFTAELMARPFGDIQLGIIRADPHWVWRTRELIESDHTANYLVCLVCRGKTSVVQAGRTAELHGGSFTLLDTARPFRYQASSEFEQVTVSASRPLLEQRLPRRILSELTARTTDGRRGSGRIVSGLLREVAALDTTVEKGSAASLSSSMLDLIVTALMDGQVTVNDRQIIQNRELLRAKRNLERHLHDPEYSLPLAAGDLGMSVRKLQNLFSAYGTTPSAWLRQVRLEQARKELLSSELSVAEISQRVGFRDVSHFSRAFRQQFGMSPGMYRTVTRGGASDQR